MSILQQLTDDMKAALRAGQKDRLAVIRMLLSDVKNIDLQPGKPTELQAVEAYHKKLRKSLDEYEKLGRTAEVDQLRFELSVVEAYLPKKLSEAETAARVEAFLAAGTYTAQQVGKATGAFLKAAGGTVDATLAAKLIRERLGAGENQ